MEEFNSKGFGGGGLPPLFFSHLSRNWAVTHQSALSAHQSALSAHHVDQEQGEGDADCYYGPGVELTDISGGWKGGVESSTDVGVALLDLEGEGHDEEGEVEEEEEEEERRVQGPANKKQRVLVPSSELKQHRGGRGQWRYRSRRGRDQSGKGQGMCQSEKASLPRKLGE